MKWPVSPYILQITLTMFNHIFLLDTTVLHIFSNKKKVALSLTEIPQFIRQGLFGQNVPASLLQGNKTAFLVQITTVKINSACSSHRFGVRFPCMSDAYDHELQQLAFDVASDLGFSDFLREGVYCVLGGPTFETVAECRMLHKLGADAVGKDRVFFKFVLHYIY